jgi:hypothetical protein
VSTFDGDVQPWMQLQVVAAEGSPGPEVPPTPGVAPDHPFRSLIS